MKKATFYIFCTLLIFLTFSCNSDVNNGGSVLRQPDLGEVKLIDNRKDNATQNQLSRKLIIRIDATVEVARRKHNPDPTQCGDCKCGLGVCGICFFCKPTGNPNETTANLYYDDEDNQYFFELALSSPKVSGIDYTLYVDEDIPVTDDTSYVALKGNYTLDSSIGKYGGYKILVQH